MRWSGSCQERSGLPGWKLDKLGLRRCHGVHGRLSFILTRGCGGKGDPFTKRFSVLSCTPCVLQVDLLLSLSTTSIIVNVTYISDVTHTCHVTSYLVTPAFSAAEQRCNTSDEGDVQP
jgi:hypothetical protein